MLVSGAWLIIDVALYIATFCCRHEYVLCEMCTTASYSTMGMWNLLQILWTQGRAIKACSAMAVIFFFYFSEAVGH